MQEIFGPVLSVYVYPDQKYKETLELVRKLTVVTFVGISFSKSSLPRLTRLFQRVLFYLM